MSVPVTLGWYFIFFVKSASFEVMNNRTALNAMYHTSEACNVLSSINVQEEGDLEAKILTNC